MLQDLQPHRRYLPAGRPTLQPSASASQDVVWRKLFVSLLLSLLLLSDVFTNAIDASAAARPAVRLPIPLATYTLQQFLKQGHPYKPSDGIRTLPTNSHTLPFWTKEQAKTATAANHLLPSAEPAKMKAVSQPLTPSFLAAAPGIIGSTGSPEAAPLQLVGSDQEGQRLEVTIPAGALDLSQARTPKGTAPQGNLTITLTQLYGHFVGANNLLGSFQIQVADAQGQALRGIHLRTPVTIIYHYRAQELSSLSMDPGRLYMTWPDLLAAAAKTHQSTTGYVIHLQNDPKSSTLTAQSTVLDSGMIALGVSTTPNQSPPKPLTASVSGNTGQLTYSYPLVAAPGPAGTTPTLALSYSSGTTNERHAPTTPADNMGDGWSLSMGSVSATKYPNGTTWYSISGVDSISDRLIPDSSGNNFTTEHLSYLKIQKSGSDDTTCFKVWDGSGNAYEFGCTTDSLQYYYDSTGIRVNYRWDLDKFTPVNEGSGTDSRVMTLSYVQDMETANGHTSITDAALKQIIYGTTTQRAGTIDFLYNGPAT